MMNNFVRILLIFVYLCKNVFKWSWFHQHPSVAIVIILCYVYLINSLFLFRLWFHIKMFRRSYKLTEYSEDILSWIRIREVQMHAVQLLSPQLERRRQLVEWTGSVAAQLKLSTQTVHLAIRYMDIFMAGHNIGRTINWFRLYMQN